MPQSRQDYGSTTATRTERGESSYDHDHPDEYVSMEAYRASMKLVRLQMSIPLSGASTFRCMLF